MTEYREEADTLGTVKIPLHAAWGPQTERSRHNFTTGPLMPLAVIRGLIAIKRAAAQVNLDLNELSAAKSQAIQQVADKLLTLSDEDLRADFPLHVYQTGSGTQTNMNVNEVIARLASQASGETVLPNDDVNHSQSSNDTFPTAMSIAASLAVQQLTPTIAQLIQTLKQQQAKYWDTVKIGRTHLQDATPLTFGQEISGWVATLEQDQTALAQVSPSLLELVIGGTAVGTGLNTAPTFAAKMAAELAHTYHLPFKEMSNKFHGLSAHSELTTVHGVLKTLAADLLKIANDVRFLGSGPRAGYGELHLPANEPGSSIMPGKVNPTQAEALTMAATRVLGNDVTIGIADSQGNFELNVYKPVLIATFLESCDLLQGTMAGFCAKMVTDLTVNADRMAVLVDQSLMTVTALSPKIGYHAAAEIAQAAEKSGSTLREAAIQSGLVSGADFDQWVDPLAMTNREREPKQS